MLPTHSSVSRGEEAAGDATFMPRKKKKHVADGALAFPAQITRTSLN